MTADALPAAGHSRRTFLLAGAGSVAAGAGALAGGAGALAGVAAVTSAAEGPLDELVTSVVAYVSDVATGEITLMVDDRETVVTDPGLARLLTRLAG